MAAARIVCTGRFSVPGTPADVLRLFTPEGERRWVDGWDPRYADPEVTDTTAPGVVWSTGHDAGTTTWIVLDRRPDAMRYARVRCGHSAGTVTVTCRPRGEADTEVEVVYDLSALDPAAIDDLTDFAAGYDDFLGEWETAVRALG